MPKRWFTSYVETTPDGRFRFGSTVLESEEHPVAKIIRWNKEHAPFRYAVTAFYEVTVDVPEMDEVTNWLGG